MRKCKFYLIFILFSFLFLISEINAYTDITSLPTNVSNTCDRYNCWQTIIGGKAMRGMRVSLMKTDGTKIGKTYNVVSNYEYYTLLKNYGDYVVLGENCNKVQYEMGKCTAEVQTIKNWDGSPWTNGNLGSAENIPYFSYFNVPLQSYLMDWKLDEIWDWADTDKLPLNDTRIQSLYNLLFGLSSQELLNIANNQDLLNDLWIVVEPITLLRYNGVVYLGTSYELSRLGYSDMLKTNIGSVVGRTLPCAAMTTGDIIQKYPDAPGVSNQSYFNNNLYFVNPSSDTPSDIGNYTINQICSTSSIRKFKNWYVNSNQGVGIGLIYFKDTTKRSLTCEDVDSGIANYDSFMSKLDEAYKADGINGIYSLPEVANGINYTFEGQQKVADKVWYINECTCYGAYAAYKDAVGTNLYELPKTSIRTIFNYQGAIFSNYANSIKNHVSTIANTKPETVGTVTTWDYSKYEDYNCGSTISKCELVDFDDLVHQSFGSPYCSLCDDWWYEIRNPGACHICDINDRESDRINALMDRCKRLPLFNDTGFTDNYIDSNKSLYNQCFDIYNSQKNTNWTLNSYIEQGCSPENMGEVKKKYNCTPKYNVGTCIDQENVYYNDNSSELSEEDYWNYCVFSDDQATYDIEIHKTSSHEEGNDLTYFDRNISSPYCEVYCIETVSGAFNSETITVKAGQHFIWDNHSISGSRTCKTKSIEWDKFRKDLKERNNKIEKAFNTYLVARDQQASISKYTVKNDCSECVSWYPTYPCTVNGKPSTCGGGCRSYRYWDAKCIKWSSASYGVGDVAASGEAGSECSCSDYPSKDFIGTKEDDYKNIVNDSKQIYNNMLKCYNADKNSTWVNSDWDSDSEHYSEGSSWDQWLYSKDTVKPYAEVHYNYKIGNSYGDYKVDEILLPEIKFTDVININKCGTYVGGIEVLTSCDANTNKCTREKLPIKQCDEFQMSGGANIEFEYPDEIYAYIEKENNTSFNASRLETIKSSYRNKTFNYIYLGYSNFPVQYSTPDGIYGKAYDNGELSITYKNLGYKLPDKDTTAVDTILSAIDLAKYGNWQCQFEVYSELIPDPDNPSSGGGDPSSPKKGDIELIYRPIDLYNPFPDINAAGRNTGSNWCYGGLERVDCSNDNETVYEYILFNRKVVGHDVYSEEPMYTFILTPAIIKEIQNYNDVNSYADYYGSYNGEVYDFKCNEGTGRTCISGYLTYLIDITGAKDLPGTCVDDQYRTYNEPGDFDACRY